MAEMTPAQRKLARHALGLPNERNRSYRNRFIATYCPGDFDHWAAMADADLAIAGPIRRSSDNKRGSVTFWLTEAGARAALDPRETLDPEDFPSA